MEEAAQLLTLTQVAVAVAGFAGIIGTFQFKDGERIRRGDAIGIAVVVNTGLMSAFYSILPLLLSNFGLSDSTVWTISSVMACFIYVYFSIDIALRLKKFKTFKFYNKLVIFILFLIGLVVIVINFLNALNIVFIREFGPFYISLIYSLGLVCYMFSRLLLRPIWRTVRSQEAEDLKKSK